MIKEAVSKVRYYKETLQGNGVNTQYLTLKLFSDSSNTIDLSSATITADKVPTSGSLENLKNPNNTTPVVFGNEEIVEINIDLKSVKDLRHIEVRHMSTGSMKFNRIQLSQDDINYVTVYDAYQSGEYQETSPLEIKTHREYTLDDRSDLILDIEDGFFDPKTMIWDNDKRIQTHLEQLIARMQYYKLSDDSTGTLIHLITDKSVYPDAYVDNMFINWVQKEDASNVSEIKIQIGDLEEVTAKFQSSGNFSLVGGSPYIGIFNSELNGFYIAELGGFEAYITDVINMENPVHNKVPSEIAIQALIGKLALTAGAGLISSGNLRDGMTIEIVSKNDGIIINEDDIELNTVNDLITGGVKRPLSAEQGKVLKQLIDALGSGGTAKLLKTERALGDFDYLGTLEANAQDIVVGQQLYKPVLYLDGTRMDKGTYSVELDTGAIRLNKPYASYQVTWVVEDEFPYHIRFSYPTLNLLLADESIKGIIKLGDVIEIMGDSDADDGGHRWVKCEDTPGLNSAEIGEGMYLNEIPNSRPSAKLDKGSEDLKLSNAELIVKAIESNQGLKFDTILNIDDVGTKQEGYCYMFEGDIYKCIKQTEATTPESAYFQPISNNKLSDRIDNLLSITSKNGTVENTSISYRFVKCGKVVLLAMQGSINIESMLIGTYFSIDIPNPVHTVRFTLNAANNQYGAIEIDVYSTGGIKMIYCSSSLVSKVAYVQGTITYITS